MSHARLTRRGFAVATTVAAATLAVPALRAQNRIEKPKLSLAVGGKSAFYYLPLTITEQLGYFKAEGLDVEISDFAGGSRALQALVGGSADVVSGAYEHTINMQHKNQYIQAFVLQGRAPQIAIGVSTKAMPRYSALGDLRGRKIGVSAPGSSTNMVANLVLSRAGVKASEVSYVGVGTAAGALTALRSGQVDAISNLDPVMTMLEQKGEVKIISDTRTLKGTQDVFGGPMPAACFYTHADFVQKNPNTCQALTNAIVHGLKWLQTAGPSDIIKAVPESYLLGDRALYLAAFNKVREAISLDGVMPDEGARTALKALASFDPAVKPDKTDLARTYTNDFARRAKDRFKA
jgi:NitT/TauT family transport system substrate-binding protein